MSESATRGGLAPWQAKRVAAYIEANINLSIRVADLACIVQLSIAHFFRAFRKSFGQTPLAYVKARRMHHAQVIMLNTREPLSQVALACGMYDQAHFTRVFRKVVGISPSAWRRLRSVTHFEDALQHDTHADREACHAEHQASRCLVSSEYTDHEFRCGVRDLRVLTELGSRDE